MTVPTVASLSGTLGHHLQPVWGSALPDTPVTGMHISELLDPAAYLEGGELLLTTGIALPSTPAGCRRYVDALLRCGVSAVALGLGPVHSSVPEAFSQACALAGLPLLVVPDRTPFLTITRAFWTQLTVSSTRQLLDVISAHGALVDACASADPWGGVLACLSSRLDGWAAVLDSTGSATRIYPEGFAEPSEQLGVEVARLSAAGRHSAASFVTPGGAVVVFPIAGERGIVGFLAVGTERPLATTQRTVVLAACRLLGVASMRAGDGLSIDAARRQSVALLILDGEVTAAERLASHFALTPLGRECRVMSLRGQDAHALDLAVQRWRPGVVGMTGPRSTLGYVLPAPHPGLDLLVAHLREQDPGVRGLISELVRIERAGSAHLRQTLRLDTLQPGEVGLPPEQTDDEALDRRLDAVVAAGPALVDALAAYLRAHGQWAQGARASGLHRNTLRHRVDRAQAALGLDLTDTDVSARLWLRMRQRGLA